MAILFDKPDDAGGNPDPTMKPRGGHAGESVKPPVGGEDIAPADGHRSPAASQKEVKTNGGAPAK